MNYLSSTLLKSLVSRVRCHLICSAIKQLDAERGSRKISVLEIGPGRGDLAVHLCKGLDISEYYILDIDQSVVEFVENRLESTGRLTRVMSSIIQAETLSLGGVGEFDMVVSSHVVEHTSDVRRHVLMLKKVLRKGGLLYIASPNIDSLGHKRLGPDWRAYRDATHISLHSKKVMETILLDNDFRILVSGSSSSSVGSLLRHGVASILWSPNDDGDSYNIIAESN